MKTILGDIIPARIDPDWTPTPVANTNTPLMEKKLRFTVTMLISLVKSSTVE